MMLMICLHEISLFYRIILCGVSSVDIIQAYDAGLYRRFVVPTTQNQADISCWSITRE